jgi:hypothetical protein
MQRTAQLSGHEPNSRGTPDGGQNLSGPLFPGQGMLLLAPTEESKRKRKRKRVGKENKFEKPERPGEPLT